MEQLSAQHDPAVVSGVLLLLDKWTQLGGTLGYGAGKQTSCFLLVHPSSHPDGSIWPLAIYPIGKAEVVFQHLTSRPPFDDLGLREELRQRLNAIPGIDLPASKLQMRPSFELDVLADVNRRAAIVDCLKWFLTTATCHAADAAADSAWAGSGTGRLARRATTGGQPPPRPPTLKINNYQLQHLHAAYLCCTM